MDHRHDVIHDGVLDDGTDATDALNVALMSYMRENPVPSNDHENPTFDSSASNVGGIGSGTKRKRVSPTTGGSGYMNVLDTSLTSGLDGGSGGGGGGGGNSGGGAGGNIEVGETLASAEAAGRRADDEDDDDDERFGDVDDGEGSMSGMAKGGRGSAKREVKQSKRAEQNRKAQQNFRKRREEHIKVLEQKVLEYEDMKKQKELADGVVAEMRLLLESTRMENAALRSALVFAAQSGLGLIDQNGDLVMSREHTAARDLQLGATSSGSNVAAVSGGALNGGRVGDRGKESNERGEGDDGEDAGKERMLGELQTALERLVTKTQVLARVGVSAR